MLLRERLGYPTQKQRHRFRGLQVEKWRRLPEIGLATIAIASALALGGAHVWVVLLATCALTLCGMIALITGSLRKPPAPAFLLASLGLYTLLQTAPLPLSLLRQLSPSAAYVWTNALRPLGEEVRYGSLSLDPGASTLEAAKWTAYSLAFWLAAAMRRRRGVAYPLAIVFASALLVALATLAHALTNATKVFGIYEPQLGTAANHIGPILNSNCLAGYLLLGVLTGLGFALSAQTPASRWLLATATAFIAAMTVLAGSRGGLGALVIGVCTLAWVEYRARRSLRRTHKLKWFDWAGLSSVVALAVAFSILGAQDAWFELTHGDLNKLQLGVWVWPMLRDFPVFGVGRGAFESAFPFYKLSAINLIFANPESIIAQWVSEWGLPFGLLGLGSLLWTLRPSRLGISRSPLRCAAAIGVGALVVQNLVDFSLELFAPMLAVTIILGACWGENQDRSRPPRRISERATKQLAFAFVILNLLAVSLSFTRGRWPVSFDRLAAQEAYQTTDPKLKSQPEALWSTLRTMMLRHPAEPYFPRLGALLALRGGRVEPLPWIEQALERGPVDSRTHWILARALEAHGFLQQALLEARLTVDYDPSLAPVVGTAVSSWSQRLEDIERAAPKGSSGSELRTYAANALDRVRYVQLREALLRGAVREDPSSVRARRALADELLSGVGHDQCSGDMFPRCDAEIRAQADALDRIAPSSASGSEVRARLFALTDRVDLAERALSERCPLLEQEERITCWRALFFAARARPQNRELFERVARRLVDTACTLELECEASLLQAGEAMSQLGNWAEAVSYFQKAVQLEPSVGSLLKLAEVATAADRPVVARRALETAAAHASQDAALRDQIEAKRVQLSAMAPKAGQPTKY